MRPARRVQQRSDGRTLSIIGRWFPRPSSSRLRPGRSGRRGMVRPERTRGALELAPRPSGPDVHGLDGLGGRHLFPDARGQPACPRAGRAQFDVPLGDGDGGVPRALGRGAPDRRGRGTAVATAGLRVLPAQDGTRDRRSWGWALCRLGDELARESGVRALRRVDEVARRYGACSEEETQDENVAYAGVPASQPTRYRDGWLPGSYSG
jgi:hypothetical protein